MKNIGFGSACVHNEKQKPKPGAPHMEAIYPTSTYQYDDAEELMQVFKKEKEGFIYSRWSNPGFEMAEEKIAALECFNLKDENGNDVKAKAQLFSSGMAAISTCIISNLNPGEKIITQNNLYGGSSELMNATLKRLGIETVMYDCKDLNRVEEILKSDSKIKMMYLESPTNPTIEVYDLEKLNSLAKKYSLITVVDNTFCSPYLQQPFKFGIDFIVHSTTKYLHGHGWAIGGVLISRNIEFMNTKVFETLKLFGGNSNAFDAWLLIQGMKTLELRMIRHCENAMKVATALEKNSAVARVSYCGLPSHPDYETAKKQMRMSGGMLSFELKNGLQAGINLMNKIKFCTLAVSLGTVDTIIQHPASMSHVCVDKNLREQVGITDGLIRLSVGIENFEDIIADLEQAIA